MHVSRRITIGLFAAAVCLLDANLVRAQGQFRPNQRPTTSPYLNLLRGANGGGTGLRYYGIVRPEQRFHQQADQFSRSLSELDRRVDAQQPAETRSLETSILSPSGHSSTFFNTGQYYPVTQQGGIGQGGFGQPFRR